MSKAAMELIVEKLGRKFNTHKTGLAFAEVKTQRQFIDAPQFTDGHIRNGLDLAVKLGHLRKVAHPTLKMRQDPNSPVIAFTGAENPHTKDLPDYSLSNHPAFTRSREVRKENQAARPAVVVSKKNRSAKPEKTRELSQNSKDVMNLIRSSEGIGHYDLYAQVQAVLGMTMANATYHIRAGIKRGEVLEFGHQRAKVYYTATFYRAQQLEQAKKEHAPVEAVQQITAATLAPVPMAASSAHTPDPLRIAAESLANTLADSLTHYLVARLTANLSQVIGAFGHIPPIDPEALKKAVTTPAQQEQPQPQQNIVAAKADRLRRPKVVIAGLKGSNMNQMVREFPHIDFDFIDVDHKNGRSYDAIKYAERVVGMSNFMSHSLENQLKDHPGYKALHTGITGLRDYLRSIPAAH